MKTLFHAASFMVVIALAGLSAPGFAEEAGDKKKEGSSKKTPAATEIDILAEARIWHSKDYPQPARKFRKGHVTPRKLDPKAIQKTKTGFSVQFPSKAPIPTPTVYQGNLYVSGGFHSKEFYCLDGKTGELVWGLDLDDDGPSSAACEDGSVVFNTESCTMFVVDAKTGKLLWSHWLGDPLMTAPTIAGGRVFTSYPAGGHGGFNQGGLNQQDQQSNLPQQKLAPKSKPKPKNRKRVPRTKLTPTHVLACFDLKTGKLIWQRWIDSDVMSAPVAVDEDLYVTSFRGTIYKFSQVGGKLLSIEGSRVTSAPVVVGKNVFYTARADQQDEDAAEVIVGQDRATRKQGFAAQRKTAVYLDQKVQQETALAQKGIQLDAGNGFAGGAPLAANAGIAGFNVGQDSVSTLQAFQGSRILNDGRYNFNCPGDEILCTDPTSGKKIWGFKLQGDLKKVGGFLAAPPVAAGGELFVSTLKGQVLRMDPKTGKVNKTYQVGAPVRFQPVVQDGRIYVGTQDGKVVCINTGDKKFTGWPTWGGNSA
ncbi:MAG: PQQ-binding-like beta-propeller repeat protein, partial [Planctomycetales bacterium]